MKKVIILICAICAFFAASIVLYKNEDGVRCEMSSSSKLATFGDIADCRTYDHGKYRWVSLEEGGAYKFFINLPARSEFSRKVIVRIPGGPGDSTQNVWNGRSLFADQLKDSTHSCNLPIVNFAYSGSAPKQTWPRNGFEPAVSDISKWMEQVVRAYGSDNVLVIAESLGPYLYLTSDFDATKVRSIMLNPLMRSPNGWMQSLQRKYENSAVVVINKNHRVMLKNGEWKWQKLNSKETLKSFFLKDDIRLKNTFADLVRSKTFYNSIVIYSPYDQSRSADYTDELKESGFSVYPINDLDHSLQIEGKATKKALELIDNEIAEFCS